MDIPLSTRPVVSSSGKLRQFLQRHPLVCYFVMACGFSWLAIGEFILSFIGTAIVITWVFNHTRGSLLIAILLHSTIDAFSSVAAATGFLSAHWMLTNGYLAQLISFGVVALLLIVVTRGRLGYQRASSPSNAVSALNDAMP